MSIPIQYRGLQMERPESCTHPTSSIRQGQSPPRTGRPGHLEERQSQSSEADQGILGTDWTSRGCHLSVTYILHSQVAKRPPGLTSILVSQTRLDWEAQQTSFWARHSPVSGGRIRPCPRTWPAFLPPPFSFFWSGALPSPQSSESVCFAVS